jgi:hypothetical protein
MLGVAIRLDAPVVSADVVDAAPDAEETALTACAVTFPETVEALAADAETAVTIRAAVSGARRSSNIRVMLFFIEPYTFPAALFLCPLAREHK